MNQIAFTIDVHMNLSESNVDNNEAVSIFPNNSDIVGPNRYNFSIDKSIYWVQPQRISRIQIFHHWFEIKEKAFIVTPNDGKPKKINEVLTCPAKEK